MNARAFVRVHEMLLSCTRTDCADVRCSANIGKLDRPRDTISGRAGILRTGRDRGHALWGSCSKPGSCRFSRTARKFLPRGNSPLVGSQPRCAAWAAQRSVPDPGRSGKSGYLQFSHFCLFDSDSRLEGKTGKTFVAHDYLRHVAVVCKKDSHPRCRPGPVLVR